MRGLNGCELQMLSHSQPFVVGPRGAAHQLPSTLESSSRVGFQACLESSYLAGSQTVVTNSHLTLVLSDATSP